jgi:hypothetical protein
MRIWSQSGLRWQRNRGYEDHCRPAISIFCGRAAVITGKCEEHRQKFNIKDREKMRQRTGARSRYKNSESYSFNVAKRRN